MWNDEHNFDPSPPPFLPKREPGIHLPPGEYWKEIDFFLFITCSPDQLSKIAEFTNAYESSNIIKRYQTSDGAWDTTTAEEIEKFIGMLLYTSVVRVSEFDKMYSKQSLYNSL